jgi:hypothetical protein
MKITIRNKRSGFEQNLDHKDFEKWPDDLKKKFQITSKPIEKTKEVKELEIAIPEQPQAPEMNT